MNVELMMEVADHIEQLENGESEGFFDMTSYVHSCGAPACIAGWTCHVAGDTLTMGNWLDVPEKARRHLELSHREARKLFSTSQRFLPSVTPGEAATVLRRFAKTGELNWRAAGGARHEQ